jgi:hypothetical protein
MARKQPAAGPSPPASSPCQAATRSGAACGAPAQSGRSFCFQHDPDASQARAQARHAGGRARGEQLRTPPPPVAWPAEAAPSWVALASPSDVRAGYAWTLRAMVEKRIDPRAANAIGVLLSGAARAIETAHVQLPGEEGTPAADAPRIFQPAEVDEDTS